MYSYNYEYAYPAAGGDAALAVVGMIWLVIAVVGLVIGVAGYVMRGIALSSIAKRRGIARPWLAWLPVGCEWIEGSLSDQYRYLVHGQVRSRRKVLMGLSIGMCVGYVLMLALLGVMIVQLVMSMGFRPDVTALSALGGVTIGLFVVLIAVLVVSIVLAVFRYMAIYDVFRSCEPKNAVAFLIISIAGSVFLQFVGIPGSLLEPIFLLVVRNKDDGMPPRRTAAPREPELARILTAEEEIQCVHEPEPEPAEPPVVEEEILPDNPEPWEI